MKPIPRPEQRPPGQGGAPRLGAVLMLLYQKEAQTHIVLTRRRDDLQSHAGQISLPGGRREPQETAEAAALRETEEELGVPPAAITVLGALTPLYIAPSDFEVYPFVGWHKGPPRFMPQPLEVAEVIETPLALLLDEQTRAQETWQRNGLLLEVPYFQIGAHKVWGATAMMLSELIERLRRIEGDRR
ncbi:MAG: CoA pyrophosphatase [Candidatus Promineifilaceae bacterium]|nr:CoA pyrophosphatase [Candidatus Promineifilaceae bacterium]